MRMKRVVEKYPLNSVAAEFYAFKRAQKIRERTLYDYQMYIDPFVAQSSNSMNVTVLKREILAFFLNVLPLCYIHNFFRFTIYKPSTRMNFSVDGFVVIKLSCNLKIGIRLLSSIVRWYAKQDYLSCAPYVQLEKTKEINTTIRVL